MIKTQAGWVLWDSISVPLHLLTGIIHHIQVISQLSAGQVVLLRITERREQDEQHDGIDELRGRGHMDRWRQQYGQPGGQSIWPGDSGTARIRAVERSSDSEILQVLWKSARKSSRRPHVFMCLPQMIPWLVWQGPINHTPSTDQVSQMENSQQSIGSWTQNPQLEELSVDLFIARAEGIFPRVASGWTNRVTHIHHNKSNATLHDCVTSSIPFASPDTFQLAGGLNYGWIFPLVNRDCILLSVITDGRFWMKRFICYLFVFSLA